MLDTNLKHIDSVEKFNDLVKSGRKAAIVRQDGRCASVYG